MINTPILYTPDEEQDSNLSYAPGDPLAGFIVAQNTDGTYNAVIYDADGDSFIAKNLLLTEVATPGGIQVKRDFVHCQLHELVFEAPEHYQQHELEELNVFWQNAITQRGIQNLRVYFLPTVTKVSFTK